MQLRKSTGWLGCLLLLSSGWVLAQEISVEGPFEVDVLLNYYDQDGDHSAVTGGEGTEDLQVLGPVILVRWALNEDWTLSADLGIDNVTSASIDAIDDVVSSASELDNRAFTTITGHRKLANGKASVGLSFSTEYDYTSLGAQFGWSREFREGHTTFGLGLKYYADTVDLYDIHGVNQGEDDRDTLNVSLSLTQVLGPNTVGSIQLDWTDQSGFLSSPFQEVVFQPTDLFPTGEVVAERLPDARSRVALSFNLNHAFHPKFVLRSSYRFYDDDWGVQAHSLELEPHFRLPSQNESWIFPILRYHTQDGSDYFGLPRTFSAQSDFFTADRDLSEFDSEKIGLGYRLILPASAGGRLRHLKSFETRLTSYSRDDGLDSFAASFGFGFRF